MFILETTHQEILARNNDMYAKKLAATLVDIDQLRVKHSRELETAKYNYDTKVARLEVEKKDTTTYNAQKHKEEVTAIESAHRLEISELESKMEIALDRAKSKYDAREIELMAEIRIANNEAELTKANAALTIERIEKDAESRIKTAEQAASVVLSNAQLEATQIVAAGKARGEELSYQIAKNASEEVKDLYEDIIDTLTTKIPLEQIDLSQVRELITAATIHFPKSVSGNVEVKNSNTK